MNELFIAAGAALVLVALLIAAIHKGRAVGPPVDREWMESFSVAKYRPMERLLSEDDFEFLAAQPGYRPDLIRGMRRERRRIFRCYLSSLTRDFGRIYTWAAHAALVSTSGGAEFASALMRQRFLFSLHVVEIRMRLVLYTFGLASVDASRLVEMARSVSSEAKLLQIEGYGSLA